MSPRQVAGVVFCFRLGEAGSEPDVQQDRCCSFGELTGQFLCADEVALA
jgi:hypothetical protein